tara:strand:- start:98 stop:313 length:216 start_codon:yes stop_codon:yes gene_type:complete
MATQLKEMKLILSIDNNVCTRRVEDLHGNTIWHSGDEYYDDTMPIDFLDNYETQMKALDFWNIVEVEKNIT